MSQSTGYSIEDGVTTLLCDAPPVYRVTAQGEFATESEALAAKETMRRLLHDASDVEIKVEEIGQIKACD